MTTQSRTKKVNRKRKRKDKIGRPIVEHDAAKRHEMVLHVLRGQGNAKVLAKEYGFSTTWAYDAVKQARDDPEGRLQEAEREYALRRAIVAALDGGRDEEAESHFSVDKTRDRGALLAVRAVRGEGIKALAYDYGLSVPWGYEVRRRALEDPHGKLERARQELAYREAVVEILNA